MSKQKIKQYLEESECLLENESENLTQEEFIRLDMEVEVLRAILK